MSWQAMVDESLMATGLFSHAAILGQAGGVWASSPDFNISPQEQTDLTRGFEDSAAVQGGGIRLDKIKYLTLQSGDRSIYGRKGGCGCFCVKTKQAIVVAVYKTGAQPGSAAKVTEDFADYLISTGY